MYAFLQVLQLIESCLQCVLYVLVVRVRHCSMMYCCSGSIILSTLLRSAAAVVDLSLTTL